jgi:3',5'-cyclic AMP phosphodiesterase CpdA
MIAWTSGYTAEPARPATAPAVVRIALFSDTHATRGAKDDQTLHKGRLDRTIAVVNAARVDFALVAGDLTEDGTAEQFDDFKAQLAKLQVPVFCVPGNHDLGPKPLPGKANGPTAERVALFEARIGPTYFVRRCAGVRIVGVNSVVIGSGLPVERAMWTWLEQELAKPAAEPTVLLTHFPPFAKTADEPGGGYWNIEPAPRQRLLALLKSGGVATVLAGHLHRPLEVRHEGTIFIVTGPVSFGLPRGKQPQGWTLVTLRPGAEAMFEFQAIND